MVSLENPVWDAPEYFGFDPDEADEDFDVSECGIVETPLVLNLHGKLGLDVFMYSGDIYLEWRDVTMTWVRGENFFKLTQAD